MAHEPNTLCKNPNCHHGEDGGRKYFYACAYCTGTKKWKAYCCSPECWDEYQDIISRRTVGAEQQEDLPERTDMTQEEVKELIYDTPYEVIEETTRQELDGYLPEDAEIIPETVGPAIDAINAEIDAERQEKRKNKKNR